MKKEHRIDKAFEYKGKKCVILYFNGHYCSYVQTILKGVSYCQEMGSYETSPSYNINCHGGITFGADKLEVTPFDKEIEYFGMDFAHSGDFVDYESMGSKNLELGDEHKWTLQEVEEETIKFADSVIKYEKVYGKYKRLFDKFQGEINKLKGASLKDFANKEKK